MKYEIKPTNKFQKDLKRIQKRGYDLNLISEIIKKLANGYLQRMCQSGTVMVTLRCQKYLGLIL